jgi:hypothetical protein
MLVKLLITLDKHVLGHKGIHFYVCSAYNSFRLHSAVKSEPKHMTSFLLHRANYCLQKYLMSRLVIIISSSYSDGSNLS